MLLPGIGSLLRRRTRDGLKILLLLYNTNNIPPCEVCAFSYFLLRIQKNPTPERRIATNLKTQPVSLTLFWGCEGAGRAVDSKYLPLGNLLKPFFMYIQNCSPGYQAGAFDCPHCHAYAEQKWWDVFGRPHNAGGLDVVQIPNLDTCICVHCRKSSIWFAGKLVYPDNTTVTIANQDLPQDIIEDYNEAASIVQKSPRGAAALLRLAIQKLCVTLGEKGKKIDDDIASLVKKGLPPMVQEALDIVRVTGNEAVHPGVLDLKDSIETASQLFGLVNLVADIMISQPKHVAAMYASLPEDKRKAIAERDKPKK
jgi:hypothetical protein